MPGLTCVLQRKVVKYGDITRPSTAKIAASIAASTPEVDRIVDTAAADVGAAGDDTVVQPTSTSKVTDKTKSSLKDKTLEVPLNLDKKRSSGNELQKSGGKKGKVNEPQSRELAVVGKGGPSLDVGANIETLKGLDDAAFTHMLSMQTDLVRHLGMEATRRILNPTSGVTEKTVNELKQKLTSARRDLKIKDIELNSSKSKVINAEAKVKEAGEKAKAAVEELERAQQREKDARDKLDILTTELNNLKVSVGDQIAQARIDAVRQDRASKECGDDLIIMMGAGMRGGFTDAVNLLKPLIPDSEELPTLDNYDPDAQSHFEILSDAFQQGRRLNVPIETLRPAPDSSETAAVS